VPLELSPFDRGDRAVFDRWPAGASVGQLRLVVPGDLFREHGDVAVEGLQPQLVGLDRGTRLPDLNKSGHTLAVSSATKRLAVGLAAAEQVTMLDRQLNRTDHTGCEFVDKRVANLVTARINDTNGLSPGTTRPSDYRCGGCSGNCPLGIVKRTQAPGPSAGRSNNGSTCA
jgi:hypothetical protein